MRLSEIEEYFNVEFPEKFQQIYASGTKVCELDKIQ